jgi:hypothetical protein
MHWWEWVFSGIGVAIAVLIGNWIISKKKKEKVTQDSPSITKNSPQTAGTNSPINNQIFTGTAQGNVTQTIQHIHNPGPTAIDLEFHEHPTPNEIDKAISAAPPYQQQSLREAYVAQRVDWILRFNSIDPPFRFSDESIEQLWTVRCVPENGNLVFIKFQIDIDEHPQFKLLHKGKSIRIKGLIKEINGISISLVPRDLTFL